MLDTIILNWNRPEHLKAHTIPTLLGCDCIRNIIISHGRRDTYFESPHPRVKCLQHFDLNAEYGLALRFYCHKYVETDAVLILDDDLVIERDNVFQLVEEYARKPSYIHGFRGRYAFHTRAGLKYGRMSKAHRHLFDRRFLGQLVSGKLKPSMLLTSFLVAPKSALEAFWSNRLIVEDFVQKYSSPLWNGEDIYLNLLHISQTGRFPIVHKPRVKVQDTNESISGISSKAKHYDYRTSLLRHVCEVLSLDL